MSQPTTPAHTKRLAGLVHRPGGITEDEAVSAATANLETLRDRTMLELDGMIQQMQLLGATLQAPADPKAVEALYALSNAAVGIAGVFGLAGVSAVAYSLCELIDRLRTAHTWNAQSVRVHLDSMRLMQGAGSSPQEERQVREALRKLVDRVPAGV